MTNAPSFSACSRPSIVLIPGTTSLSAPLEFRRAQDFFITSRIEMDCNRSLSYTTIWTVHQCSSSCSRQTLIDPTVAQKFSEIYFPARTLFYGTYELKLTVTMSGLSKWISSASAYVKIMPSPAMVNLVPFGTSMIPHGYEYDLKFDPGRYSVDPDESSFNASVSE